MADRHLTALIPIVIICFLVVAGCTGTLPQEFPLPPTHEAVGATLPALASAPTVIPNETLVAFVDEAVAYVGVYGREKALAEFSDRNGSFVRGELYIFAYDFNGTTLAHPVNPEKIGINRLNETQGDVGLFLANMSAVARNGSGYYRFTYINPAHNRIRESKLGYAQKIDDTWWIGSGVYTGPA